MKAFFLAVALCMAASPVLAQECNKRAFTACAACHALTTDAGRKPGPQLAGVTSRKVAGDPAFAYSPVLKAANGKGDAWSKEKLDEFLKDPQAMYPGTWMGSPPVRDARQRADILCVLGGT
jgi:cytochrome c